MTGGRDERDGTHLTGVCVCVCVFYTVIVSIIRAHLDRNRRAIRASLVCVMSFTQI